MRQKGNECYIREENLFTRDQASGGTAVPFQAELDCGEECFEYDFSPHRI